MDLAGEHHFSAPRDLVWACFLDPEALRRAMPGCEELREAGPDEYAVAVTAGLKELHGTYRGTVRIAERRPPESYRLVAEGSGKSSGITGGARFTFHERGGGTVVHYDGRLTAKSIAARLTLRVMGGPAKALIGQFMKGMEREVAARAE